MLLFLGLIAFLGFYSSGQAHPLLQIKSAVQRQNFLELYSSEGCSSCPAAEKWLGSLKVKDGLWTKFVPVEFHVDYWDNLGWKDPYASADYTLRQKAYAQSWGHQNIYTPGVVLNGREWTGWRRDTSPLENIGNQIGVLEVTEESRRHFSVKFKPLKTEMKLFVNGALLGNNLQSKVSRGENSGENLHHDFVALNLTKVSLTKKGDTFEGTIDLSRDPQFKASSLSIAFWITDDRGNIIQATGGDLAP